MPNSRVRLGSPLAACTTPSSQRGPGCRGIAAGPGSVLHPDGEAVAAAGVTKRADQVLLCRDDRFFPAELMRRVVRERLGITPDGDGRQPLCRPQPSKELADRLGTYRAEQ